MNAYLVAVLLVIGVLIGAGLHRVFVGPTVFDRLVAVSLLTVNSVVMIVVMGFVFERPSLFLDIALSYALLAFLLPIALGRYFEHRGPDRPDTHGADAQSARLEGRTTDGDGSGAV